MKYAFLLYTNDEYSMDYLAVPTTKILSKMRIVLGLLLFILVSCSSTVEKEMTIMGVDMKIPSKMVYLTLAENFEVIIDSAEVIAGNFTFNLDKDTEPFKASIKYFENGLYSGGVFIVSPYPNRDGSFTRANSFMLEQGVTKLTGTSVLEGSDSYAYVQEGIENGLLLKTLRRNIGGIATSDENKYKKSIERVKKLVRKHPNSFYLLHNIYSFNRNNYKKEDLADVLELFNDDVKFSKKGRLVSEYLEHRLSLNEVTRPLSLRSDKGEFINEINKSGKLNMLVFWASWCGPCRSEIPQIKEIFKKYESAGLNVASISIDKDEEMWRETLKSEYMNWNQFIVPKDSITIIEAQYNFNSIPLVVFTDEKGKELIRFQEFKKDNVAKYSAFIDQKLIN